MAALSLAVLLSMPVSAQDAGPITDTITGPISAEQLIENARRQWTVIKPDVDPCAGQESTDDVIVVCRHWEDGSRFTFERPAQLTVSADVRETAGGAPRAPDFNESCLHTRGRANCLMGGYVPPPAVMLDFDTLPETPAGSDAARLYGGPTDAEEVVLDEAERASGLGRGDLRSQQDVLIGF